LFLTKTVLSGYFVKSLKTKLKYLFTSSHRCAGFYHKNELYVNRYEPFCGPELVELAELGTLS